MPQGASRYLWSVSDVKKKEIERMPELGFQEHGQSSVTPGFGARDPSPDSVIFTLESNFSLSSSASASVDRCSFASDAHDHDSIASEISLQLAGPDCDHHESSGGTDPDPNKLTLVQNYHSRYSKKGEKSKVQKEVNEADIEDSCRTIDSATNSFSLALKECWDRRSKSEALSKKLVRRRPALLDLNNVTASSPRLGSMKKSSISSHRSGIFLSPGTPNYRRTGVGMQKGWSSERVPLHTNAGTRHVSAALLPFNNGRTLPSKWEDAERWIFSPVSGDGVLRPSIPPPQRRQKSKSGPLGPPGIAYYSLYSPAMPMFEAGNVGNFMAGSPFSARVIEADRLAICSNGQYGGFPVRTEPFMARSVSVHGCSEQLEHSSLPGSQDGKSDGVRDAATNISCVISRRDMATQMSPERSSHLSPKRSPLSASTSSALPIVELQSVPSCKLEVRDVQVDERVTLIRWSKKQRALISGKGSKNGDDWKEKVVDARFSAWDISDTVKSISTVKREEAKITAWENLQKAKAEAALRKLEMKLEKKRSSSIDKIMNKLRSAQKRAQEMRSSVLANQAHQAAKTFHKAVSFRRPRQMGSLSGCFTCHAF